MLTNLIILEIPNLFQLKYAKIINWFCGGKKKKISRREKWIYKVQIMDVLTFMCIVLLVVT